MARRRFQEPEPEKIGKWWSIRVRKDFFEDGKRVRRQHREKLCSSSKKIREVKKIAAQYLLTINQGLQTSLKNVSDQQTALAAQLAAYSARLTAEYNAMDTAVALLKQTQTYLNAEFNPSANAASGTSQTNTSLGSGNLSV